jgi:hypothetical protein
VGLYPELAAIAHRQVAEHAGYEAALRGRAVEKWT